MSDLDPRVRLNLDSGVATITIAQPEKRNAVAPAMWDALAAHFDRCATDPEVRVVILTGEGESFCSGSDLEAIDMRNDINSGLLRLRRANRMVLGIYSCPKPVIAAVRGPAVGVGWSLALACDYVVASDTARFTQGFVKVGLMPDGGAVYFLSGLLGSAQAKDLAFSGRFVDAAEALKLGLVVQVHPDAEFDAGVRQRALQLAAGATSSMSLSKRMFRAARSPSLEQFLDAEELAQVCIKQTSDFQEGVAAFKAKRKPQFTGS